MVLSLTATKRVILFVLAATGCAPTFEAGAKSVTKGAAIAGADVLADPRRRQMLADALSSAEMRQAVRTLVADGMTGLTEGASGDDTHAPLDALTRAVTRAAVDAILAQASGSENERRLRELATLAGAAFSRGALQAAATDLPDTLAPAVDTVVRATVALSVRTALNDSEARAALASAVYEVSREAVFGTNEAMAELERKKEKRGLLAHLSAIFAQSGQLIVLLACSLVACIIALGILLVRTRMQMKRYQLEHDLRRNVNGAARNDSEALQPRAQSAPW